MQVRLEEHDNGQFSIGTNFGRPKRPPDDNIEALLLYVARPQQGYFDFNALQSHFGSRAAAMDPIDRPVAKREMLEEIDWLEKMAQRHKHVLLLNAASDLSNSYSSWFCHTSLNEDKGPPLQRCMKLLEQASFIEPNNPEWNLKRASMLIYTPQVRNYAEANAVLEKLQSQEIRLLSTQAERVRTMQREIELKNGTAAIPANFDYGGTYSFQQEKLVTRSAYVKLKKAKDIEGMKLVLDHLYRLAAIHYCHSHLSFRVRAAEMDNAVIAIRRQAHRVLDLSYAKNGRFMSTFLGKNDDKAMELVWGFSERTFDPVAFFKLTATKPYCS